eukprot:4907626-Amphidinium_carterae.2
MSRLMSVTCGGKICLSTSKWVETFSNKRKVGHRCCGLEQGRNQKDSEGTLCEAGTPITKQRDGRKA